MHLKKNCISNQVTSNTVVEKKHALKKPVNIKLKLNNYFLKARISKNIIFRKVDRCVLTV